MKTQPRPDGPSDADVRRRQLRILRHLLAALYEDAAALAGTVPEGLARQIEGTEARIAEMEAKERGG